MLGQPVYIYIYFSPRTHIVYLQCHSNNMDDGDNRN